MMAFFFFTVLGLGYILSSLMAANSNFLPLTQTLKNILFLPMIIMGLVYGGTSVLETLALEDKNSRIQVAVIGVIFSLLALLTIIIHFAL